MSNSLQSILPIVTILGFLVAAIGAWITIQRYKTDVLPKRLSYFVDKDADDEMVRIYVWNSGNAPIEQEDYISSPGFVFGNETQIRDACVEYRVPEELDVEIELVESKKLKFNSTYLNPKDRFVRGLYT